MEVADGEEPSYQGAWLSTKYGPLNLDSQSTPMKGKGVISLLGKMTNRRGILGRERCYPWDEPVDTNRGVVNEKNDENRGAVLPGSGA